MNKLEEILTKHIDKEVINDWKNILYDNEEKDPDCIEPIYSLWTTLENGIYEYAEWYAKECLKIAAVSVRLRVQGVTSLKEEYTTDHIYSNDGIQDLFVDINVNSILNIKLPEHG